jgi:hypothetical protein
MDPTLLHPDTDRARESIANPSFATDEQWLSHAQLSAKAAK